MEESIAALAIRLKHSIQQDLERHTEDAIKKIVSNCILLEQHDFRFHKLDIVHNLKQTINNKLSHHIDTYLSKLIPNHIATNQSNRFDEAFLNAIATVSSTPEYLQLQKVLLQETETAVEQLIGAVTSSTDANSLWNVLEEKTLISEGTRQSTTAPCTNARSEHHCQAVLASQTSAYLVKTHPPPVD